MDAPPTQYESRIRYEINWSIFLNLYGEYVHRRIGFSVIYLHLVDEKVRGETFAIIVTVWHLLHKKLSSYARSKWAEPMKQCRIKNLVHFLHFFSGSAHISKLFCCSFESLWPKYTHRYIVINLGKKVFRRYFIIYIEGIHKLHWQNFWGVFISSSNVDKFY